jgi:hypothetical protein
MKIPDSVLLSLYMRDYENSATSLMPPSGTQFQFSTLINAEVNDPEEPEIYNNTEVKHRAALLQLPHGT